MFTKKPDVGQPALEPSSTAPAPPKPPLLQGAQVRPPQGIPLKPGEKLSPSVIGSDLTIIGNLISKGEVQVDGAIQGDLHANHVVVGERARITGGIVADDVILRGHVEGSVRGLRVTLQSSSRVEGDVYHQSLAIEQGAYFEGKSRRAEDPLAGVKAPEVAEGKIAATPLKAAAPRPAAAGAGVPNNGIATPPTTSR